MRYAEVFMNHFALNGVISPQELYYYALRAVAMLIVIPYQLEIGRFHRQGYGPPVHESAAPL